MRRLLGPLALVAVAAVGLVQGEFASFVVGLALVYVVAVSGLHLLLNDAGQISLAHGAFVAVGAFTAAHVASAVGPAGLPLWLASAAAAGAVVGGLVSLPVLRLRGFTVAVTTWLFAVAAERFLLSQPWFVGETAGLAVRLPGALRTARMQMLLVGVVAAFALVAVAHVRTTRFGRSLYAVRSNEAMAASVGIDVARTKVAVFVVAGATAGLAGGLWTVMLGRAVPSSFPPILSVTFLAMAVIGGRGALWGPVAAAFLFAAGPELFELGRVLLYVSALGLALVLIQFPGGLNEQGRALRRLVRR